MWTWECFTPHPPIIVPEVGRGRESEAKETVEAMKKLPSMTADKPDILLVLSPHAPFSGGITFTLAETFKGNFSSFGAPKPEYSFPGTPGEGRRLAQDLSVQFPVAASEARDFMLDHGALVPLSYLLGGKGEYETKLILANPIGLSLEQSYALGRRLGMMGCKKSWGLLASGDLSHRVTEDAPAGYSPQGAVFDQMVVEALRTNDPSKLLQLTSRQIERAGECGLRSALIFLGLGEKRKSRLLSYEAPFGVGYAVAFTPLHGGPDLARRVIEFSFDAGERAALDEADLAAQLPELSSRAACFVTLKKGGELRGCIGTLFPQRDSLAAEIAANALSAAFQDPRFHPLTREELGAVSISVDILSAPEAVTDHDELDPKKYGVIVEKDGARGVLLPDLEGVDRVEQQISIAATKAGIKNLEGVSVQKFTVQRVREADLS